MNAEEYPDYPQIIKIPIDLSTVRNKLLDGDHENPHDFARDIRLIFTNSKNYNTNKHSRVSLKMHPSKTIFYSNFSWLVCILCQI